MLKLLHSLSYQGLNLLVLLHVISAFDAALWAWLPDAAFQCTAPSQGAKSMAQAKAGASIDPCRIATVISFPNAVGHHDDTFHSVAMVAAHVMFAVALLTLKPLQ